MELVNTSAGNVAHYEGHEFDALERAKNYYDWLLDEFEPALHGEILEVGAGAGTLSEILLARYCDRLTCVEPAANLVPVLQERLQGSASQGSLNIIADSFEGYSQYGKDASVDSIICVNVLEHIQDDRQALREMRRLLKPAGHLCLFVPALPFIYGTLDESFGHHRRYTKSGLKAVVQEAGLSVIKLGYFNLPGSLAWLLMGRVLRWKSFSESPVKWYDRSVIPLTRFVESVCPPPFGQSLLMIAVAK